MKNTVLKFFVIFFFIIQIISLLIYFNGFENAFSDGSFMHEILLNKQYVNFLFIFSFVGSFFYIVVIFMKLSEKSKTYTYQTMVIPPKDTSDSKAKLAQEQKNLQAISEKKKQIAAELSKNLSTQTKLEDFANQVLINISKQFDIFQGIFFVKSPVDGVFRKAGTYAYYTEDDLPEFSEGIGLTGQVAENKKLLNLVSIPEQYITVLSGLGKSSPSNLIIFPVVFNNQLIKIFSPADKANVF